MWLMYKSRPKPNYCQWLCYDWRWMTADGAAVADDDATTNRMHINI